jgi:hypothetical protein
MEPDSRSVCLGRNAPHLHTPPRRIGEPWIRHC